MPRLQSDLNDLKVAVREAERRTEKVTERAPVREIIDALADEIRAWQKYAKALEDEGSQWVVYEEAKGQVYNVTPATEAKARKEAKLAGIGHTPLPRLLAMQLANAYNHGVFAAKNTPAGLALTQKRVYTAGGAVLNVHAAPEHLGDGIVLTGQLERPSDDRHFWVYLDPKAWAEFATMIGQPHKATVLALIAKLRKKRSPWRGDEEDWQVQGYEEALDDVAAALSD